MTVLEHRLSALVIGSGLSGLSAAAGLSKVFDRVTLLDRDDFKQGLSSKLTVDPQVWRQEYEAAIKQRQGVLQYRQPHILLVKGLEELEVLFPGYTKQLLHAGAVPLDVVGDVSMHDWGLDFEAGHDTPLKSVCASRHLYENVARDLLLNISNVTVETGAAVKSLQYDTSSSRVTGVVLKDGQKVAADLVVDASGANSRISKWLDQIGHPVPPMMTVDAGLQYNCRMYEMTDDPARAWKLTMIMDHPEFNRVGVLLPIEHNKWQVLLAGYKGHQCPSDEAGFLQFARNLPCSNIYDTISKAKPLSPISLYTQTGNIRRRFEQVPPPHGLCVIGDAVCHLNPVYGQGMTVGVMGSALLGKCVKEGLARAGPSRGQQLAALDVIPTKFHTQLEGVVDYPWTLASGPDAVKPNARVELPKKKYSPLAGPILNYFVLLQKARFSSLYLMTKVQAVGSMAAPAGDLFKLDVVSRVAYWWLRSKLGMSSPEQQPTAGQQQRLSLYSPALPAEAEPQTTQPNCDSGSSTATMGIINPELDNMQLMLLAPQGRREMLSHFMLLVIGVRGCHNKCLLPTLERAIVFAP